MNYESSHVTAFAIQTRDGYIAQHRGHSTLEWRSDEDAHFFTDHLNALGEKGVIVVGNTTYKLMIERLSKRNCIVFTRTVPIKSRVHEKLLFVNPQGTSLPAILSEYDKVALLGGTETYTYFLKHDLIDEMYVTAEPIIFGKGLPLFTTPGLMDLKLRLASFESLNEQGTFLRHYERRRL